MKTKAIPLLFLVMLLLLGIGALINEGRGVGYNQGYGPTQPIAFSHKIHAGDNKIACLYCHFAAEKGRHAGIPPVQVCLNCHNEIKPDAPEVKKIHEAVKTGKTIEWIKVNHYPDFAYFNHSQHVRVANLQCQECHGPVETMVTLRQEKSLSMGMCLDCHRKHEIAPPNDHKSKAGGDCARCHY